MTTHGPGTSFTCDESVARDTYPARATSFALRLCASCVLAVTLGSGCAGSLAQGLPQEDFVLVGMVYGSDFLPIAGATVFVDENSYTTTDRRGRFRMHMGETESHTLTVKHPGYQPQSILVRAVQSTQVIHFSLSKNARLERDVVQMVRAGHYDEALSLLVNLRRPTPSLRFLLAVALWRSGDGAAALSSLRDLQQTGFRCPAVTKLIAHIEDTVNAERPSGLEEELIR